MASAAGSPSALRRSFFPVFSTGSFPPPRHSSCAAAEPFLGAGAPIPPDSPSLGGFSRSRGEIAISSGVRPRPGPRDHDPAPRSRSRQVCKRRIEAS